MLDPSPRSAHTGRVAGSVSHDRSGWLALLFPPRETGADLRDELAAQGRAGLSVLCLVGALVAVSGMGTLLVSLSTGTRLISPQLVASALQNQLTLLAVCVAAGLLTRRNLSVSACRLASAIVVLLASFLLLRRSMDEPTIALTAVGFVFVMGVALTPYRPWMVFVLGLSHLGLLFGVGRISDEDFGFASTVLSVGTLVGTGFGAVLYSMRRRAADQQAEARVYRRRLEETNRRLEETRLQLVQTEKMASLGNLAAGVAHEINTPMGAIRANADLTIRALDKLEVALERGDPEAVQRPLAALRQASSVTREATERIVRIVRSLRSFARLDEAEEAWTDLNACIESTLPLVQHEVKNGVQIETHLGPLPKILCHPNQINQVIMNLLINGIQALEGKGTVSIETEELDDGVRMRVRDDGCGIAPDNLDRIFDPGFTTKGVGVGTGLGLSIVYRIVHSHGGTIQVDSTLSRGTTMQVSLPRGSAE